MSLDHHDHVKVPAIVEREGERDVIFVPRHEDPLLHQRDDSVLDLIDDGEHDLAEVDLAGATRSGYSCDTMRILNKNKGKRPDWYTPPREEKY